MTHMEQKTETEGVLRMRGQSGVSPPTTDEARPRTCPRCGQPAFEGGEVWIHGHGVVQRQQRGPEAPGKVPVKREVACRRYRCKACTAVLTVVPASALARKHFSAAAMALALTLWGLCGWSAAQVRAVVGGQLPPEGKPRGWRTLARWARQVADGKLWASLESRAKGAPRQVAARAAQALCGWAPPWARAAGLPHQAFAGACHVN
jgi:hypothetical protein